MLVTRPRGTNDILPGDTEKWQYVESLLRDICTRFGYEEIRTPIFEETDLFKRGVGDTTDIVQKEMYTFQDFGGRSLTLRPEGTASTVRAYVENKLYGGVQPAKYYYIGPMFRYEKPQAGRFRQFHQFGIECFGAAGPTADAEVISLAWQFYRDLGLKGLEVHINSVGCPKCRPKHRKKLQEFLAPKLPELCGTCQGRYEKNPMRILDCKSPICQELSAGAPTTLECLCDECREHFQEVLRLLDAAGIQYQIDNRLVRGLDYYTKTAFEIIVDAIGAQSAICGGGRYDGLIEELGGQPTPGVGFALGMERVFPTLKVQGIELEIPKAMDVFVAVMGQKPQAEGFRILTELRHAGIKAETDSLGRSLKAQMKYANRFNVAYTVILGEAELEAGRAVLRNMSDSSQEDVPLADIVKVICEKMGQEA